MAENALNCFNIVQYFETANAFLNSDLARQNLDGLIVIQLHLKKMVESLKNHSSQSYTFFFTYHQKNAKRI
jgi:hypothetical protein